MFKIHVDINRILFLNYSFAVGISGDTGLSVDGFMYSVIAILMDSFGLTLTPRSDPV